MTTRGERALWFVAAFLAAAAAAAPVLPPPLAALALAITWGVTPGAWLARRLAADEASDVRAALALLVSPFVCGAALLIARQAGAQATLAAPAISFVLALLAVGEALRPAPGGPRADDPRPSWPIAILFGALLLLAYAFHPALVERSDGSFHAGVVRAAVGKLPPEDPFFAGLPLRYAWGVHAWAAGWLALCPRLQAYTPLAWANAGAAIAALLAVAALARRLGASPRTTALAQVLALAGAAPFTWLVPVARALLGDVRGGAEISYGFGNGADLALRALDPGTFHASLVLPLDKFVVLTPFAFALAGGAVALRAMAAWQDTRSARALGCLAFAVAATTFAHPFTGVALGLACACAVLPVLPLHGGRRILVGVALALAAAAVLTLPYLLAIARPDSPGAIVPRIGIERTSLVSVFGVGAIVLPAALRVLVAGARRDAFARFALGVLIVFVLAGLVLQLELGNQSKFLSVAFLLASAPAAVGWARLAPSPRRVAAVVLALAVAPTLAAMLWAYAHQGPHSVDSPSRPPDAILAEIERWLPRDAVVVDATLDSTRGAAPALPGATGRSLLWGGGFMRKWWHAPEVLAARGVAAHAIERGTPFAPVAGLSPGRELWLILPDTIARAASPRERVVARASGVSLVRLAP